MDYMPITLLVYEETLMEKSEDDTNYIIDEAPQYIAYDDEGELDEHLEMEWLKDSYDGAFYNDYDTYTLIGQTENFDDDDNYIGFERIYRTDDNKEIVYELTKRTGVLVFNREKITALNGET